MKRLAFVFALLVTGCWTDRETKWTSVPASLTNVDQLANGTAEVTLANGAAVLLNKPASYDDALCDRYACVRKADITAIRRWSYDDKLHTANPALLLVAPLALPWLALWAGQASYEAGRNCDNCPVLTYAHPAVLPDRQWLSSGFRTAEEAKLSSKFANPCIGIMPSGFETDLQALGWIYDNRKQVIDVKCLESATQAMSADTGPEALERRLRMTMLLHARSAWIDANCWRGRYMRMTPHREFAGAPTSQLDVIAEVLADDTSYLLPLRPEYCRAEADDIPSRTVFAEAMSPFSLGGPWASFIWSRDLANIDND